PTPVWPPTLPTPALAQASSGTDAAPSVAEDKNERHVAVELTDGSLLLGTMQADAPFLVSSQDTKMKIAIKLVETITFSNGGKTAAVEMQNGDRLEGETEGQTLALKGLFGNVVLQLQNIASVYVQEAGQPELVFRNSSGVGRPESLARPASIGRAESIATKTSFKPPLEIVVIAKTDSNNLRVWYTGGAIFDWEQDPRQLRFDGLGGNQGKGNIPVNQYVTIRWTITPHGQKIYVDGALRHEDSGDYSKVDRPVIVYQRADSVVTVRSIKVNPLASE
ncbi:MAG TPA: hypothetical protein VG733_05915, partial [Chthoniobacteraceae bacterium]|nr:hypothetical protein [Chthoniobacteraceae bacterium]